MINTKVIIHDEIVRQKLLAAAPRILANNRLMVTAMLKEIKPTVIAQTPTGPGHFGYHLKDSYKTDVQSKGVVTTGILKSPPQGYWREYGTRSNFKKGGTLLGYVNTFAGEAGLAGPRGGERALMLAHKALNATRKFIRIYYGNSRWWGLP